ncbi:hypothetical protein INT43_004723 [Umbelopsis isabellina]|uniref:Uncharacterized protein n=1 Tax=Mortierella isabellina TaxID=91625 RepID=A0A8H7UBB3_MORIS|nr:hypothetical protein INT43_004723 [Umbelopsis isabellina]
MQFTLHNSRNDKATCAPECVASHTTVGILEAKVSESVNRQTSITVKLPAQYRLVEPSNSRLTQQSDGRFNGLLDTRAIIRAN